MGPSDTLQEDSLTVAVRAAGIDVPPVFHASVGSTNDEALRLASEGAPAWTVVAAGHQTAGRGRLGRSWVERPGRALLLSVILRPGLEPERAPILALLAATSMAEACRSGAGVEVGCKWPNDLMVGERKTGGVLAESRVEDGGMVHMVIGAGVNLAMEPGDFPEELRPSATSLAAEGGTPRAEAIVRAYLEGLLRATRPEDPRSIEEALARYRSRCVTLGRSVQALTTEGSAVEGTAIAIDERGGLVVETRDGTVTVAFGEVAHLDRPP
jgi:BirA family transcriptional regulator, biotin operon repressor / biotin---[acetyl-CoA-carboxylase] ligase